MSAKNPAPTHPKEFLYGEAYDPLVRAWFGELHSSAAVRHLLDDAPGHDLVENLQRLDALLHELVESDSLRAAATSARVTEAVSTHRAHIIWEDQLPPPPDASPAELMASFRHKLKRNISLAAIEATIVLESALRYARHVLHLTGDTLEATLRDSTVLPASLAALHDEREKVRMRYLTGCAQEIMYPAVGFADVVAGRFRIDDDKFTSVHANGRIRIRFRRGPREDVSLPSPTMICPAQRLNNADDKPLNNDFWHLLIDIYRASGRFR